MQRKILDGFTIPFVTSHFSSTFWKILRKRFMGTSRIKYKILENLNFKIIFAVVT